MDFLNKLRKANYERGIAWADGGEFSPLFMATEIGGEVGELLNVIKKLERAKNFERGSTATHEQLEDEIGDVLICLDRIAEYYDVDIAEVTARKFNKTSEKVDLPQRLEK